VGGVSERAGAKAGESNLSAKLIPSRVVAVKDILVFWKATPFAGRRRNEGLGRSVSKQRVSPEVGWRADDSGCPEDAEEGNAVGMRAQSVCTRRRHERSSQALRGRVLRSVLRPVHVDPHYASQRKLGGEAVDSASRLGKLGKPRGTSTGARTDGRSAARHVSPLPQGRGRDTMKKRMEVEASLPARIEELGFSARTSKCSCRSR
jgi:hypothetical protein